MRKIVCLIAGVVIVTSKVAFAAPQISDAELRKSVEELSASMLVGGEGWTAYQRLLHPEYSRWSMGVAYEGRERFLRSLEEWWKHGMRVADRNIEMIAVDIVGNVAVIRYETTESFVGPNGPVEGFSGFVSNTWKREDGQWLLLSADVVSGASTD